MLNILNSRKPLNRRRFLRGAGSVAIGLPFLPEFAVSPARAQAAAVPPRLVTMYFGLGLDPSWQNDFSGPLEPLAPFAGQMTAFSASMSAQNTGGGAHCETGVVLFNGEKKRSDGITGGATLDVLARQELDSTGPILSSGLWWRAGGCTGQQYMSYRPDGTPRDPLKRPSAAFDALFGTTGEPTSTDPSPENQQALLREQRIRRSILDGVLAQYQSLTGPNSYLGALSKQKLELHLQSIREIELTLAPMDAIVDGAEPPLLPIAGCQSPSRPTDPSAGGVDYDAFTHGTGAGAPQISWQDFQAVYRAHADIWALALRCDRLRFGNLAWESKGGHTNFTGTYSALGSSTDFPGTSQHDSFFHDNQVEHARLYQHYTMTNLAYFLSRLADETFLEANGQTVLHNTCIVLGTEYGWNHSVENVFHAVVGAQGRFQPGFFTNLQLNCADVYNAVLESQGLAARVGQAYSMGDARVAFA